jgi:hypothetical protein
MKTHKQKGLGWRQRYMLDFMIEHGADKTYTLDPGENVIALSLERRGLIKIIDCGMSTANGRTVLMATVHQGDLP